MNYIAKFGKSYPTVSEYALRLARFVEVDAFVKEVNAEGSEFTHTATHNKFSDWTREEFKKMQTL